MPPSYAPPGIPFPTTATGGLFARIGKIGNIINVINTHRGTTIPAAVDSLNAQYATVDQEIVGGLYNSLLAYQNSASTFPAWLKTMAGNSLVTMVNDYITQESISSQKVAMQFIVDYMVNTSNSVQACTVSASSYNSATNVGSPVCVISMKSADGLNCENAFSESPTGTVTQDSQTSSQYLYQEQITVKTPYSIQDPLNWQFPVGSGVTVALTAVNALSNSLGGTATWLNNGAMESWIVSANFPDGWHPNNGTVGSDYFRATGTNQYYDGFSALQIKGNGSTNFGIYQQFSLPGQTAADTPIVVYPLQQVACNLFLRVDVVPAAGVLTVALKSSGSVINDDHGTPNSFTVSLPSLTTSFKAFNSTFRLPSVIPQTGVFLDISMTTPMSSGSNLFVDRVALAGMTPLYADGPSVAIFSGNTRMIKGDTIVMNIFNNYGGKFQRLFDTLFGMRQMGLKLPSSNSPTISDSLIS